MILKKKYADAFEKLSTEDKTAVRLFEIKNSLDLIYFYIAMITFITWGIMSFIAAGITYQIYAAITGMILYVISLAISAYSVIRILEYKKQMEAFVMTGGNAKRVQDGK